MSNFQRIYLVNNSVVSNTFRCRKKIIMRLLKSKPYIVAYREMIIFKFLRKVIKSEIINYFVIVIDADERTRRRVVL